MGYTKKNPPQPKGKIPNPPPKPPPTTTLNPLISLAGKIKQVQGKAPKPKK